MCQGGTLATSEKYRWSYEGAKVTHRCVADVIWPFTLKCPAQRHDERNGDFSSLQGERADV
jgi:hypothetical protein